MSTGEAGREEARFGYLIALVAWISESLAWIRQSPERQGRQISPRGGKSTPGGEKSAPGGTVLGTEQMPHRTGCRAPRYGAVLSKQLGCRLTSRHTLVPLSKDLLAPVSPSCSLPFRETRPRDLCQPWSTPGCPTWEDEDEAGGQAPNDRDDFSNVGDEESQEEGQQEPADGLKQTPPPLPNYILLHRHPSVAEPETLQDSPADTDPGQGRFAALPLLPAPAPASSQRSPATEVQDGVGRQHAEDDEGPGKGNRNVVGGVGQQDVLLHAGPKGQEATDACREGSGQLGTGTSLLHECSRDQTWVDAAQGTSQRGDLDSPPSPLCPSADQKVPALQKPAAPLRTAPHSRGIPLLTSARVDEERDHHGRRHHRPPGLHLRLLHAVKDGHGADVALPGTRETR